MKNPRVYKFDCTSWYWNAFKIVFKLKTKDTVIPAKTIVDKDEKGEIDVWNIKTSKNPGPLYIVTEDTIPNVDKVVCLYYGEVKQDAIVLPNGNKWDDEEKGLTISDHMILRSQIKLI